MEHYVGVITEITQKKTSEEKGSKPYLAIKVDNLPFNLFKPEHKKAVALDMRVDVGYTEGEDGFRNVQTIVPALATAASTSGNGGRDASIERQVDAKCAAELAGYAAQLWIAGKVADDSRVVIALCDYIVAKLKPGPTPQAVKETKATPPKATEEKAPSDEPSKVDESPIRDFGDLFSRASKYFGLDKSNALKLLAVDKQEDIGDLDTAWQQIIVIKS